MDIRSLQAFLHLVETRSFSKASAILGVTQPALSRQIKRLEEELGQSLLHRDGRGITLTPAGRIFVSHARAMVEQLQGAKSELANLEGEPKGIVTLGLPPTMSMALLPGLVRRIRASYPRIMLRVMQGLSGELNEWLVQGRVDAAVLAQTPATRQRHGETLVVEDLFLIGPRKKSADKQSAECSLIELQDHPLVLPTAGHGLRASVEAAAEARRITLNVILEIDSLSTLVRLAQDGIAYAVLPRYVVAKELELGTVTARKIVEPPIQRTLMLATSNPRLLTPAGLVVIQAIREEMKLMTQGEHGARAKRPFPRRLAGVR